MSSLLSKSINASLNNLPSDASLSAQVYAYLSLEAIDLIDNIIKPQNSRFNLKQILKHSWMKMNRTI